LTTNCAWGSAKTAPVVYAFGCAANTGGTFDSAVRSTAILHGNFDYKTNGVADWDGGSTHALKTSMYYTSKPGFFGSCAWPAFGPDLLSMVNQIPAQSRYNGATCSLAGMNAVGLIVHQ
jgi:hypothetical protein